MRTTMAPAMVPKSLSNRQISWPARSSSASRSRRGDPSARVTRCSANLWNRARLHRRSRVVAVSSKSGKQTEFVQKRSIHGPRFPLAPATASAGASRAGASAGASAGRIADAQSWQVTRESLPTCDVMTASARNPRRGVSDVLRERCVSWRDRRESRETGLVLQEFIGPGHPRCPQAPRAGVPAESPGRAVAGCRARPAAPRSHPTRESALQRRCCSAESERSGSAAVRCRPGPCSGWPAPSWRGANPIGMGLLPGARTSVRARLRYLPPSPHRDTMIHSIDRARSGRQTRARIATTKSRFTAPRHGTWPRQIAHCGIDAF